jgi:hypothetical protein
MKTTRETRDMEEAKMRAKRARAYAEKFPTFSSPNDPWCDQEWQFKLLSAYRERSAAQKE